MPVTRLSEFRQEYASDLAAHWSDTIESLEASITGLSKARGLGVRGQFPEPRDFEAFDAIREFAARRASGLDKHRDFLVDALAAIMLDDEISDLLADWGTYTESTERLSAVTFRATVNHFVPDRCLYTSGLHESINDGDGASAINWLANAITVASQTTAGQSVS